MTILSCIQFIQSLSDRSGKTFKNIDFMVSSNQLEQTRISRFKKTLIILLSYLFSSLIALV